ncbi:MAG: hypothetical protein WC565_02895 [Parcubacteria group bacterium]
MPDQAVDLSEFFKLARPKKPPCRVGFAITQLKPAERTQLNAALATDSGIINAGAIREWLRLRGQDVSNSAILSHRQGSCTCHDS